MQFIDINKAKGIKFGEPILGKATDGRIYQIKAVSKSEDVKGIHYEFDFAHFDDEIGLDPMASPDIVAVAIPKPNKASANE